MCGSKDVYFFIWGEQEQNKMLGSSKMYRINIGYIELPISSFFFAVMIWVYLSDVAIILTTRSSDIVPSFT